VLGFLQKIQDAREAQEAQPAPRARWNIDLLADLMGESVDALQNDPEARKRGWQRLFDDGGTILLGATSGSRKGLAMAKARLHAVSDVLRAHDIDVDETPEKLLNQLHDLTRK
jgi:hypothetical protein